MKATTRFEKEGLTYDDVLLVPAYSEVLPREEDISLKTKLTRELTLNCPIASAAMDTVTESQLAIALAQEGGIGVLHKSMSIERQAEEVKKVKRSENGMILDPISLPSDATTEDALIIMHENGIGGIPIVSSGGHLEGILTNRDLRFEKDLTRPVSQVMTKDNLITTDEVVDLKQAEHILQQYKIKKLPVVDKDKKLVGLITFKDIVKVRLSPNAAKDSFGRLVSAAAVGVTVDMMDRVEALVANHVDAIVIDTAHGHSMRVVECLKNVKKAFPDLQVIVGNIATAEAAIALASAGADAVKVGIGPGSICTTRIIAGVGVPQLTAIAQVAEAFEGTDIPIIADGGIRYTGDIVKALAAGAGVVMTGSLFAGVEESPGETIIFEGRKFKSYRGMGSVEAMQEGSKDRYFQDMENDNKKLVPEGISGRIPYKGSLREVVHQIIGGIRAGMGYTGSPDLKTLQKAEFIRITNAGITESHVHDVTITREAPNYSR
ncbi:MAG: IMP dehydrogenase [Flavobacteriales bacterium]|nr:IMP dehydrogenase [Flavobacteriales bacterium]